MHLVVKLLVTSIMALHAGLGCCAHHEHQDHTEEVVCTSHHCHTHHDESSGEQPVPENCDEEQCVFVKGNTASADVELLKAVTPLFVLTTCADTNTFRIDSRAAWEDCLHPAGPALHLWHGVLVI